MADDTGLPEGAVVGPSFKPEAQANGLPEGAVIGPAMQTSVPAATAKSTKPQEPGMIDVANKAYEGPGVMNALGRLGMAIPNMARGIYHAAADAPKDETEQAVATSLQGPLSGRAALAAKRLLVDPGEQTAQHLAERRAQFEKQGEHQGLASRAFEEGTSRIPVLGPIAYNLADRAAGTGPGEGTAAGNLVEQPNADPSGAFTEAAGYTAAPEIAKEARPGGKLPGAPDAGARPFPTADAAVRTASRVAVKAVPAAPYVAGAIAGHPYVGARLLSGITDPLSDIVEKGKVYGLSAVDATAQQLGERAAKSAKVAAKTQVEVDKYRASKENYGVEAPEDVLKANEKAQLKAREDALHAHAAKQAADAARAPKPAPQPEVPTEQIEAMKRPGAPKPAAAPQNVKTPGQVQPEVVPQPLLDQPRTPTGRMRLPDEQGTMGTPRQLTVGTNPTSGSSNLEDVVKATEEKHAGVPKLEAPAKPVVAPKVEPKVETPAPKPTGMRDMNKLKVNEKGEVEDTSVPKDRLHQLLQQALETETPKANEPAAPKANEPAAPMAKEEPKVKNPEPPRAENKGEQNKVVNGKSITQEEDPKLGNTFTVHDPKTGAFDYFDTREEAESFAKESQAREANPEPTHAETKGTHDEKGVRKEPANVRKPGEELTPEAQAVQHKALESISSLSNDRLDTMAREMGIDPSDPIYSRAKEMRGASREQTGRIRQANAILERMGSDEINKAAAKADQINGDAASANWARAKRADAVFEERLSGAPEEGGYGSKNTGVTKEAYEAARKRAQEKLGGTLGMSGGNLPLSDWAIQAKYHIEAGARSFADFSEKMLAEAGEAIRPHLQALFEQANGKAVLENAKEATETTPKLTNTEAAVAETEKQTPLSRSVEKTEHREGERRKENVPVEDEHRTGERRNAAGLRVDEEGNPTLTPDVEGHWQESAFGKKPAEDIGTKVREANPEPTRAETKGEPTTVGGKATVDTAKSDNEHFANAKKELGDKASIREVADRAQELKDRQSQADAHRSEERRV